MKIAVISDTHDHLDALKAAVREMNGHDADLLIHCGDLCSPFMIPALAAFEGPVHIVSGNNEGDSHAICSAVRDYPNIEHHGEVGFIRIGSGEIAFTHRPEFASGLASMGRFIAVFYGHTHRRKTERMGDTWLVNPGEMMGLIEEPGWLLFDSETGEERRFTAG